MSKTAAIIGATGLVGTHLLQILLEDELYSKIWILGRKSTNIQHPKLEESIGDLLDENYWNINRSVDDVFCCIGTTQAKTSDLSIYKNIDFGIPVKVAQWGLKNNMQKFIVISAMGANKNSRIFYNKIKGQMEEALQKLKIKNLYIVRPALILGSREEFRFGETLGKIFVKAFGFLIPKKYKGIHARSIAFVMHYLAVHNGDKIIYESDDLHELNTLKTH